MAQQAMLRLSCPKCQHVIKLKVARLPKDKPMGMVNCTQCGQAIKFKIPHSSPPKVEKTEVPDQDPKNLPDFSGILRDDQDKTYPLKVGVNILGRKGTVVLPSTDKKISRQHCAIEVKESHGSWLAVLSDDGSHTEKPSTNGTFFEDKRLSPYDKIYLENNDRFRVGQTIFTFKTS